MQPSTLHAQNSAVGWSPQDIASSCFETLHSTYRSVQGASVEGLRSLAVHQRRFGDVEPSPHPFEVARGTGAAVQAVSLLSWGSAAHS